MMKKHTTQGQLAGQAPKNRRPEGRTETWTLPRHVPLKHAFAALGIAGVLAAGVIASTAYWVLRDDMLASAANDRTQIETLYQDRIDRLRAEIERLNSRRMVDRESVEQQVANLMQRQNDLSTRHGIVADLMSRAERSGIRLAIKNPVPTQKPALAANAFAGTSEADALLAIGGESEPLDDPFAALGLRGSAGSAPEATASTPAAQKKTLTARQP
ncbi:hypothetical protein JM93_00342 [Roseibium hamelinense]|uniref:Uncharacterized protein n=2 Tax=Roseibium hamelinense TaxID=150831 RepID=A0A562THR2_9HYPH|nr:hypothetical protein JM93_00342 [Roseibium hamelinense]